MFPSHRTVNGNPRPKGARAPDLAFWRDRNPPALDLSCKIP
jgi:hypothetical protein